MPNFPSIYLELQELWKKLRNLEESNIELLDLLSCISKVTDPSESTLIECDLRISGSGNPNLYIGPDATDSSEYIDSELLIVGRQSDAYISVTDTNARTVLGSTSGAGFVGTQTDSKFSIRQDNVDIVNIEKLIDTSRLISVSGSVTITGSLINGNIYCKTNGIYSHAEGDNTKALGQYSHAEGYLTIAQETASHAEGNWCTAEGMYSHAEGAFTTASALYAHSEGRATLAQGEGSHTEGCYTKTETQAAHSHAEGYQTTASAEYQHVEGKWNKKNSTALHLIGNGTADNVRSNILEVYTDKIIVSGNLEVSSSITASNFYSPNARFDQLTASNALIYNNITVNGTASIALLETVSQSSLKIGDKYITILSGASTHAQMNGAGILWGSGSTDPTTGDENSVAYALYRSGTIGDYYSDYIEIFPGLKVSGSTNITNALTTSVLLNGLNVVASGAYSHAEGESAFTFDSGSHAEGYRTEARARGSHSEGIRAITYGIFSHAEGYLTKTYNTASHAEGLETLASGNYSHAEGNESQAIGEGSHAEGRTTTALANYSHAEGYQTTASGDYSHAEGSSSYAIGYVSHAEGRETITYGSGSHAEGYYTTASGNYSHAEGRETNASGYSSHAEGLKTIASRDMCHSEGVYTEAYGYFSHAEGSLTYALGNGSHAEGYSTTASGDHSHAEGYTTYAVGEASHTEGLQTTASADYQHVQGKWNVTSSTALMLIGNGTANNARSNILEVYTDSVSIKGDLKLRSTDAIHFGVASPFINPNVDSVELDSYEEGTWTPVTSSGITGVSSMAGSYIKVGNLVHITGLLQTSTAITSSGNAYLTGFPYVPMSNLIDSVPVLFTNHSISSRNTITNGYLYGIQIGFTWFDRLYVPNLTSSDDIKFSCTYKAKAP